jgi:hypothetical protein
MCTRGSVFRVARALRRSGRHREKRRLRTRRTTFHRWSSRLSRPVWGRFGLGNLNALPVRWASAREVDEEAVTLALTMRSRGPQNTEKCWNSRPLAPCLIDACADKATAWGTWHGHPAHGLSLFTGGTPVPRAASAGIIALRACSLARKRLNNTTIEEPYIRNCPQNLV